MEPLGRSAVPCRLCEARLAAWVAPCLYASRVRADLC